MNGVGVHIMDYLAGDPGSVPEYDNFFLVFCFKFFPFCFFVFVSFFLFIGKGVIKLFHLTSEPPITQCSKQLQRNGVHANDFNNFVFKKLQEEKRPF